MEQERGWALLANDLLLDFNEAYDGSGRTVYDTAQ